MDSFEKALVMPTRIGLMLWVTLFCGCVGNSDPYRMQEEFLGAKIPRYTLSFNAGQSSTKGALSMNQVQESLKVVEPRLRYCYEDSLLKKPKLEGQLNLEIKTNKNGQPTSVKANLDESTIGDQYVAECFVFHFRAHQFPAAITGDTELNLNYLFALRK